MPINTTPIKPFFPFLFPFPPQNLPVIYSPPSPRQRSAVSTAALPISSYLDCLFFGKNKRISKGKKGGKKKAADTFAKNDWYDVKAPEVFTIKQVGKTLVSCTQGKSKNKRISKGKKGGKKKAADPFAKKDWYGVKAPGVFTIKQVGKTLVSCTRGTKEDARDMALKNLIQSNFHVVSWAA